MTTRRTIRLLYSSDIHGSEVCFRKWLNAATVYEADALIFGGDLTGKLIVPIVRTVGGSYRSRPFGEDIELNGQHALVELADRLRATGRYPVVLSEDEKAEYDARPELVRDRLFPQVIRSSVVDWMTLAEERLATRGINAYFMLGNDDFPALGPLLEGGIHVISAEGKLIELPGGFEMISLGYSNPTPWRTPRELEESELEARIRVLAGQVKVPERAIFNLHVPPYGTGIDHAALLDETLRPRTQGGQVVTGPVGSTAVRAAILEYQPMLGLHGHIHESAGGHKLKRTLVVNPGSDYGDGVLRAALITLQSERGLRSWQLIQG